jgi:hypothetical protein
MSSDDFDNLKRLLALKRYEQPPPGYFENFSDRVISRIEAEELSEYSSWWQWLVAKFDAKPVVAGAYGLTVSGLLLAGFHFSETFENEVAKNPTPTLPWLATTPASVLSFQPTDLNQNTYFDSSAAPLPASVNSLFRSDSSHVLFNGQGLPAQPISFSTSY